jgi:eukaryotic-like serine/threonine-protein kinase
VADLRDRLQSALGPAYTIDRELGGGGMSRVFLADEVRLSRQVVVKVLPPEMAAGVSGERFEREIRLAAALQHPHIVPVLTAGSQGDLLYYVMPHITGESLRARLARQHELPVAETVRILRDVCDALAYAHAHGIVHRDVKPDNVLFSGKHALVTDFGVAKAVASSAGSATLTSLGMALGTPAYMAPEQAAGEPGVDQRADIYAVGVLGYEMLAGRPPFSGLSPQGLLAAQVTATPDPLTRHRDSVPAPLADLIMRCLAKRPADRPQSAEELVGQLEAIATPTEITPALAAAAIRRAQPGRVAALFLFAAIGALTVDYLLFRLLGLPDWAFWGAVGLVAIGIPVIMWTGVIERRRALAHGSAGAAPPGGIHRWFTWRRALTGGVSAFGLLGLGTALYMAMRLLGIGPVGTLVASGVLAERDGLVLADFENHTSDSTLGRSVGEAFRVDLAQSRVVRLLDAATVADALMRMGRAPGGAVDGAGAREIALREGAKGVVLGRVDPLGRGFVLSAELLAAADGAQLVAVRETARDDGAIIDAVDRLSKRLRERIGESLKTIRASEPLERVTTASLAALQRYSQAVKASEAGEWDRAVDLLEQAIALDSGFAMAQRKMTVVLSNTGASSARITAAAIQAFRHRDRLPPLERDLTDARYYSVADYDLAKAEDAYRAALDLDPNESVALNNLALLYMQQRRFAVADSLVARGLANPHPMTTLYMNAATAQVGMGRLDAARGTVRQFAARFPAHPLLPWMKVLVAASRGDYDSATVYSRGIVSSDLSAQAQAAYNRASLYNLRGQLAAGGREWRRFMEVSEARQLPASYVMGAMPLAIIELFYRENPAAARDLVDAALARHPLAAIAPEDRPYSMLAWFYAEAGQADRARRLMAEYERVVPEGLRRGNPLRHEADAAVALAAGRVNDAIRDFRATYDESGCAACGLWELGQAYDRAQMPDSALAAYERAATTPGMLKLYEVSLTLGPTYRRLGELYEARGDRVRARNYYGRFVDLWKDADPELQPLVKDVRARIIRLTAEPTR